MSPESAGSGGWRVHGKTGSGWLKDREGNVDRTRPMGWFVGWAAKGRRRLVFARFEGASGMAGQPGGLTTRNALLAEIGRLAG